MRKKARSENSWCRFPIQKNLGRVTACGKIVGLPTTPHPPTTLCFLCVSLSQTLSPSLSPPPCPSPCPRSEGSLRPLQHRQQQPCPSSALAAQNTECSVSVQNRVFSECSV